MDSVEKCKQTLLDLGHVEFTFEDFLAVSGVSTAFYSVICYFLFTIGLILIIKNTKINSSYISML